MPRFEAREWILNHLKFKDLYEGKRPHNLVLPVCSRTGDVIEYRLKPQWFLKMSAMNKAALEAVENGHLLFDPPSAAINWSNFLKENRDWCISRQLWWGHRMPIYWLSLKSNSEFGNKQEIADGISTFVVAHSETEAMEKGAKHLGLFVRNILSLSTGIHRIFYQVLTLTKFNVKFKKVMFLILGSLLVYYLWLCLDGPKIPMIFSSVILPLFSRRVTTFSFIGSPEW